LSFFGIITVMARNNRSERAIWSGMKQRCLNPKCAAYCYYGGRGITVCDRWLESFENFFEDMGPRPSPDHSIDRINNDLGYFPENCAWRTRKEQMSNRRCTYIFQGRPQSVADITTWFGCARKTMRRYVVKNNGNMEAVYASLELLRQAKLRGIRNEVDTETNQRLCEVGTGASENTAEGKSVKGLQKVWGDVGIAGNESTWQRLPKKQKYDPPFTGHTRIEVMNRTRIFAIRLKLSGLSYSEIARRLDADESHALRLVGPSLERRYQLFDRAKDICERCGTPTIYGQIHHVTTLGKTPATFNRLDNLEYICVKCHGNHHKGRLDPTDHYFEPPVTNHEFEWSPYCDCQECSELCHYHYGLQDACLREQYEHNSISPVKPIIPIKKRRNVIRVTNLCDKGHDLTKNPVYINPTSGRRICVLCRRATVNAWNHRRKGTHEFALL
jgi:hypothetical protein